MSVNTSCDCDCDDELGLPVGPAGAAGDPGFLNLSYVVAGAPFNTSSTSYVEVGRFIFSNTIADPFEAIRNNVWVSAGTGSLRVKDLITGNVLYENTNITATSSTNIETVTGQSIYNVTSAIIAVEVKQQNGANSISIASSIFYYT